MSTEGKMKSLTNSREILASPYPPSLPFRHTLPNGRVVVFDNFREEQFPALFRMAKDAAQGGHGFAPNQVQDERQFHAAWIDSVDGKFVATDESGVELLSFGNRRPSYFCRSTNPVCSIDATLVRKDMRGSGLGRTLVIMSTELLQEGLGYLGHLNVIMWSNAAMLRVTSGLRFVFLGHIPKSILLQNGDWQNDVVAFDDYEQPSKEFGLTLTEKQQQRYNDAIACEKILLSPLKLPKYDLSSTHCTFSLSSALTTFDNNKVVGKLCSLQPATDIGEILKFDHYARQEALTGEGGFAIDEFTKEGGYFNRKFFRASSVLLAKNKKSEEIGAVIIGPTALCRYGTQSPYINFYIIVDKSYRRQGYGTDMLALCEELGRRLGFDGAFVDCFITNVSAIALLEKTGRYSVTGGLRKCGYICRKGFTTSLMFLNQFLPVNSARL